ncbi:MAG: YceI family protein [Planctomycetes bacterium]|nr:YceI family protein [Planctomycetota bacterium]
MKRILAIVGVLALLAWTGLGLFVWSSAARRVTVAYLDEDVRARDKAELLELKDELGALHQDVRALAGAMGENLQALNDALLAAEAEHAGALEHQIADLREETRASGLAARELATSGAMPAPEELFPEAAVAAADPVVLAALPDASLPVVKPRKSFLAFQLPSDDLRFDERRAWSILPALSRVGFDGKSTLHDFTATTSELEGELEADLSRAGEAPRARVRVRAATLASDNAKRDVEMRALLAVEQHPTLDFELTRFEPAEVDVAGLRAAGTAHGRLSVRGVTQEIAMPVRLSIDDARRLLVEGEVMLDLTRFQVSVPNKLGLITMEKEVKVWISLRLRANPRSQD